MAPTLTPQGRSLRSNSNTRPLTINDVKELLEGCKAEIIDTFKSELSGLSKNIDDLKERVKNIEVGLSNVNQKLANHDNEIECLKSKIVESSVLPEQILNEFEQRNLKANNVIVSGLSEVPFGSPSERSEQDLAEAQKVICGIVDDFRVSDIKQCFRLGKPIPGKIRPLRLTFYNHEIKNKVLKNTRKLMSSTMFKNVYINPDRTRIQQLEFKNLRSEFTARKKMGEDVVIRNQRVVPRADVIRQNFS